jgi:hypothetical protein
VIADIHVIAVLIVNGLPSQKLRGARVTVVIEVCGDQAPYVGSPQIERSN